MVYEMRIVCSGRWTYDEAIEKPVDIVAFDFDWWHQLAVADGEDPGESQPVGPDGCLYYVRFRHAGERGESTWVDSAGYAVLEEAKHHTETRVPSPVVVRESLRRIAAACRSTRMPPMTDGALVVADPWWDLRAGGENEQQQRDSLADELRRELNTGHPLFGATFEVIASCGHCDDVLLRVGPQWAIVHLTWGIDESPPWPVTTLFDAELDVEDATATHEG